MPLNPLYTPDPEDPTKPADTGVAMGYAFKEIRFLKSWLQDKFTNVVNAHNSDTNNPHAVTKAQVGLGNVPDWDGSTDPALGTSETTIVSQNAIRQAIENTLQQKIYPVGSYYITESTADPATILGFGTWTRLAAGKSLVSHDPLDPAALGTEIGNNAINLTESQLPAHSHPVTDTHQHKADDRYLSDSGTGQDWDENAANTNGWREREITTRDTTGSITVNANPAHTAAPIDIRNEARIVNIWRRTV